MGWGVQISATFVVVIFTFFIFWLIYKGCKKAFPNLKFKIKYGLLGKKYKEKDIEFLKDCLEDNVSNYDLYKVMVCKNPKHEKKAREMIFIYDKMKKGGERS